MAVEKIENLDEFIRQYVGSNKSIVDSKVIPLIAPGENYWSTMLQVDVTLKDHVTGKEEELHAVGKCLSCDVNEMMRSALPFNYRSELTFYREIIPTLQAFQPEQGVKHVLDIFPKLYTARSNLDGDNEDVDEHAVLLIENLKVQGYQNVDRHIGFNVEEAKFILKDLAAFHAVPLALKLVKPDLFAKKIRENCKIPDFEPPPPPAEGEGPPLGPPEVIWLEILEEYEECKLFLPQLKKKTKYMMETKDNIMNRPAKEPFATIVHNDMWVNNTMQKFENGKIVKNKFVDFQMYRYGNPAEDLLFFIFSSIAVGLIEEHLDNLIKFYYENFIRNLEELKCDASLFTYDKFLEEVHTGASFELFHIIGLSMVIYAKKGEVALDFSAPPDTPLFSKENITQLAKEKIIYTINKFGKKGWIE